MRAHHRSNFARTLLIAVLLCGLSFSSLAAPTASRALKVIAIDSATRQTGEVNLYNKSVAVIIGIDEYSNLPADKQLTYAVKDARGMADVLKRQYKFDKIFTLYNTEATRDRILDLLTEELPNLLGEQDALFIFWAGHGNQESSREGELGYLIPYDGDIKKIRTNITMDEIRNTISKKIPAKHIFYVMDACYSGLLTETRSVDKTPRRDLAYLQDITKERVRQVLTAGGKNQEVLDGGANGHSIFTGRLIELLEKTGDFITANEIQTIIKEKVNGDARARNHKQTPAFGTLYGTGDFVFVPSLEQKVADNRAEIAKLEAELKQFDAARLAANQTEILNAKRTLEGKLKVEQLKQDQLAAEQQRREVETAENKRLLAAKSADDQHLVELKAAAETRRKNSPAPDANDFPTVQAAVAEIKRLNERINTIEAGYQRELAQARKKVGQSYAAQIDAANKAQRDEFETAAAFKARQYKRRSELSRKGNAELARLTPALLAAAETDPLRESIKTLSEREYTVGAESLIAELGTYNAEAHQFPISVSSQNPVIHLTVNGSIQLPLEQAKTFKQQWLAGLVRPEAKVKPGSDTLELALVNDADNSRWIHTGGAFISTKTQRVKIGGGRFEHAYQLEMVVIPAGSFDMGSLNGNSDESPVHRVTIEKAFALAKTEVTQKQWKAIMGNTPSKFTACGDKCPVENVSWDDAQAFIQKLNAMTGKQYRLPSEAEWAYACSTGKQQTYCGSDNVGSVAWYEDNSGGSTHPVATKQANAFGLYDMSGNVWEWVEDSYHNSYTAAPTNGSAWQGDGTQRVLRGGSWYSIPQGVRAARRSESEPTNRYDRFGFRLAATLP